MAPLSPKQRAVMRRNRWAALIVTFLLLTILNFVYDSGAAILATLVAVCSAVVVVLTLALEE